MLEQSLTSAIEDLDLFVGAARCQTGGVRMELYAIHHAGMVSELLDLLTSVSDVPDSHCSIVGARSDHP